MLAGGGEEERSHFGVSLLKHVFIEQAGGWNKGPVSLASTELTEKTKQAWGGSGQL